MTDYSIDELNESVRALNDTLKKLVLVHAIRTALVPMEIATHISSDSKIDAQFQQMLDSINSTLGPIIAEMRKE